MARSLALSGGRGAEDTKEAKAGGAPTHHTSRSHTAAAAARAGQLASDGGSL